MRQKSVLGSVITLVAVFASSCAIEEKPPKEDSEKLSFSELSETFEEEGNFTASEILENVFGEKEGYSIKEIKNVSDTSVATLGQGQVSINFEKSGEFTANLILEHDTKADSVIDGAKFKILGDNEWSFNVLRKRFVSGGSFTAREIIANVSGKNKASYSLKQIKDISDTSVARLSEDKRSIQFVKAGFFTATLVLENEDEVEISIKKARFKIAAISPKRRDPINPYRDPYPNKGLQTLTKTYVPGGYFSEVEIQSKFGNARSIPPFVLLEVKNISDTSVARLGYNKRSVHFVQPGSFTADVVFSNSIFTQTVKVKFVIKRQRGYHWWITPRDY